MLQYGDSARFIRIVCARTDCVVDYTSSRSLAWVSFGFSDMCADRHPFDARTTGKGACARDSELVIGDQTARCEANFRESVSAEPASTFYRSGLNTLLGF